MTGWENVAFMHLCITRYISPPELVCLILTSRDLCETYGNPETYRAVAKSFFGPAIEGPRGHLSRRHRQKKGMWRAGDGAKARLSLLWQERTRTNVARLQNAHLLQQREHERSRCGTGPVVGSAYRCAAGCLCASNTKAPPGGRGGGGACAKGRQQRMSSRRAMQSPGGSARRDERERSGGGGNSKSGGGHSVERGGDSIGEGGYTLCESCFSERRQFHPPHPFARLRAGFAGSRLSGPVLYEAVCGDCSFGSLVLVRPLKAREAFGDPVGSGDLGAVPVSVEAAGPLPLSQVKSRIAAGDRDDNRGLAFASENWLLQPQQQQAEERYEGGEPVDPLF